MSEPKQTPKDWRRMAEELLTPFEESYKYGGSEDAEGGLMSGPVDFEEMKIVLVKALSTIAKTARDGAIEEAAKVADGEAFEQAFDVTQEMHNILCKEIASEIRKLKDKERVWASGSK